MLAVPALAGQVPLKALAPAGADAAAIVPMGGGIPFPKGALKDVANVRILGPEGKEIPAQVTRTAVWPDGSVKWAFVDIIRPAGQGKGLRLEYGPAVRRARVAGRIKAERVAEGVRIEGGGVRALIRNDGNGVIDEFAMKREPRARMSPVFQAGGAKLIVEMLRIEQEKTGEALPVRRFVSRGSAKGIQRGRVKVDSVTVEVPGPIRATVLVRGHVLLPDLGKTLPDKVKRVEPHGRLPFSMRLSFYRGLPLVFGQHQIVYTGEPDCDFIARWAIELPGLGSRRTAGSLVLEPGVELTGKNGEWQPVKAPRRRVDAPLAGGGFALIRHGWENRPAGITFARNSAFIDFWPRQAGYWDLRRYAREWAVGETGRKDNPADMIRYAKYAARGIAKSHDFVIHLGTGPAQGQAGALADRTILTAPPGWMAASEALGAYAPEQSEGPFAEFDKVLRRTIDYYLFNQDLYRWHGKLEYGYWQTRNGNIHRNDRWERDYGRWGWSLGDGAGRIGHMLMLSYLRTLERRFLTAGEAFCRILYDTNIVHTKLHLENASSTWWPVQGCAHRHNVQPFGCPYIGMRGSYPVGARILYLVTGDGVIKDGLDLVANACVRYLTVDGRQLGSSGGSDGQGSGANALLFAYETTGEKKYLDLCRKMLDKSKLIPPPKGRRLGYGPSFGLFNAAGEYAEVSGDKAFQKRVIETARIGLKQKRKAKYLYTFAMAHRFGGGKEFLDVIRRSVSGMRGHFSSGLQDLPPSRWPGHGGARTAGARANLFRDLPYALKALDAKTESPGVWPASQPFPTAWPPKAPANWHRPGGKQTANDRVPSPREILSDKTAGAKALDAITSTGTAAGVLAGPVRPFVILARPRGSDPRDIISVTTHEELNGPVKIALRLREVLVEGARALRVEMAIRIPKGTARVTSWGLRLPLALGSDRQKIQLHAPGAFRTERWRVDMNDDQTPEWLLSDKKPRWPLWRLGGIAVGPAGSYRIWRANRHDTSPLYTDQGFGSGGWFDVTDRSKGFGVTVRLLRPAPAAKDMSWQAVEFNVETGILEIQFHDAGAPPAGEAAAVSGLSGAADIIFHDGWRPPLGPPALTRAQYAKLLKDLNYGENFGLFAYRLRFSTSHKRKGPWDRKIMDDGIEPRELLQGMLWRDGLGKFCRKVGVAYDANDPDRSIREVVKKYKNMTP